MYEFNNSGIKPNMLLFNIQNRVSRSLFILRFQILENILEIAKILPQQKSWFHVLAIQVRKGHGKIPDFK